MPSDRPIPGCDVVVNWTGVGPPRHGRGLWSASSYVSQHERRFEIEQRRGCSWVKMRNGGEDGFVEASLEKARIALFHNGGVRFYPLLLHCYAWQCPTFNGSLVHHVVCRFSCPCLSSTRRDQSVVPFLSLCGELVQENVLQAPLKFTFVSTRSIGSNRNSCCPYDCFRGFGWREKYL